MTTTEPIANHLDILEQLTRRWDGVMVDLDEMPDDAMRQYPINVAALACYLKFLGEIRRAAQAAEASLARRMADAVKNAPPDVRHVANVGTVDVRPGRTIHRYKDNPGLVGHIAARAAEESMGVDESTGEMVPTTVVAQRACHRLAEVAGITTDSFSSWRKGEAEKLGIDLREYRSSEYSDNRAVIL